MIDCVRKSDTVSLKHTPLVGLCGILCLKVIGKWRRESPCDSSSDSAIEQAIRLGIATIYRHIYRLPESTLASVSPLVSALPLIAVRSDQ